MNMNIDGLNINYIDEGKGNDVLLLHGWGANIDTMIPIFNILKKDFRVVSLDIPGFGKSDLPKEPWNTYDYAKMIKTFTEKLNMKNIILFGHSHGGRISIILSSQYDNLVKKLVLIDSTGVMPKRKLNYYIKIYSFKILKNMYLICLNNKNKEEKLEKFYKRYGSTDYKNANNIMRQTMVRVLNDNLIELLPKIKIPTLLIWGENDKDTPLYMGKKMEEKIEDSGLIVLKDAGHYSYIDCFNQFKAIILAFLKEDVNK